MYQATVVYGQAMVCDQATWVYGAGAGAPGKER